MDKRKLIELYSLLGLISGSAKALDIKDIDTQKVKEHILSDINDILKILDTEIN